jgi:valine dehydrogenase (NAD+)
VDVFESGASHEQVVFCNDPASGLRAIIAIYSTALGPALGGTRFYPYATEADALEDVLNLSRAMAYKAACAGLDLGGGKAVIIGDPATDKSEALLRAYGRFVQAVGGRYYTACDVGTYVEDMDIVARECSFVTGRSPAYGGAGDSSILTAYGVFQGMRAAAEVTWGAPTLQGRHVGIAGVGKVGSHLVEHLLEDGASIVIADVSQDAVDRVREAHPEVDAVAPEDLIRQPMDLYAPCALGAALTDESVMALYARVVCGAANNQVAHPGIEKLLEQRGVLYAPDYVVNSGGLIQVADEIEGYSEPRARVKSAQIYDTTLRIFSLAAAEGVPPSVAADRLAERRMEQIGGLGRVWLPTR